MAVVLRCEVGVRRNNSEVESRYFDALLTCCKLEVADVGVCTLFVVTLKLKPWKRLEPWRFVRLHVKNVQDFLGPCADAPLLSRTFRGKLLQTAILHLASFATIATATSNEPFWGDIWYKHKHNSVPHSQQFLANICLVRPLIDDDDPDLSESSDDSQDDESGSDESDDDESGFDESEEDEESLVDGHGEDESANDGASSMELDDARTQQGQVLNSGGDVVDSQQERVLNSGGDVVGDRAGMFASDPMDLDLAVPRSTVPSKRTVDDILNEEADHIQRPRIKLVLRRRKPAVVQAPTSLSESMPERDEDVLSSPEVPVKKKRRGLADRKQDPSWREKDVPGPIADFYHRGTGWWSRNPPPSSAVFAPTVPGLRRTARASPASTATTAGPSTRPPPLPNTLESVLDSVGEASAGPDLSLADRLIAGNQSLLLPVGAATVTLADYLSRFPSHRQKIIDYVVKLLMQDGPAPSTIMAAPRWSLAAVAQTRFDTVDRLEIVKGREAQPCSYPDLLARIDGFTHALCETYLRVTRVQLFDLWEQAMARSTAVPTIQRISEAPTDLRDQHLSELSQRVAAARDASGSISWDDATNQLNKDLPEQDRQTKKQYSTRYSRDRQMLRRQMARHVDDISPHDLQSLLSRDHEQHRLPTQDQNDILASSGDMMLCIGETRVTVADYLVYFPEDRQEVAEFIHPNNPLRDVWATIPSFSALEALVAQVTRLSERGKKKSTNKEKRAARLIAAKVKAESGLISVWDQYEREVRNLRSTTSLTIDEIAARMNRLLPRPEGYDHNDISQILESALAKQRTWSYAECFKELEALETLARHRRAELEATDPALLDGHVDLTFTPRDYEDVPEVVLRHMAEQRGVVQFQTGRGKRHGNRYRNYMLGLMLDDAERGIAPLRARALDAWSDSPATHDTLDLLALAARSRDRLDSHFIAYGGEQDEEGNFINPYAPTTDRSQFQHLKPDVLRARFIKDFGNAVPASLPRGSQDNASLVPHPEHQLAMLWYLNAREGIDPPLPVYGQTGLHALDREDLQQRAVDVGLKKKFVQRATKAELRTWMFAQGATSESAEIITPTELQNILDALGHDLFEDFARLNMPVSSIATVGHANEIVASHNRRIIAPRPVYRQLEASIARSIFPDSASTRNYLCGITSTLQSLNSARRYHIRGPELYDVNDIMPLLFQNWNPTATYAPGTQGTATPQFAAFLHNLIQNNLGFMPGTQDHNDQFRELTTINMSEQTHLQNVLDFMLSLGLLERRYVIGVVTAAPMHGTPANAHILGDFDDDTPIVWLHHDNAQSTAEARNALQFGVEVIGHYVPFRQYGERTDLVDSWGLHRPGAEYLPARKIKKSRDKWSEKKKKRSDRNADKRRKAKQIKMCESCKCADCKNCEFEGKQQPGADWEEKFDVADLKSTEGAANLTEAEVKTWDAPEPDWEVIAHVTKLSIPTPLTPGTTIFALHVHSLRFSTDPGPFAFAQAIARLPVFRLRVQTYVNSGLNNPEARLLGGVHMPIQFYGLVFKRRGILPVPTTLTNNLADPRLRGFVILMQNMLAPGVIRPRKFIISTSGIPGMQVGILMFGDRTRGFFKMLYDADPVLARNTSLMTVVKKHVHHGFPHSIPAQWQQYFTPYHNMYMFSNPLQDLVYRNAAHMHYANLNQAPPVMVNAAYSARLDAHILLLDASQAWRAHWLDANTNPTDVMIALRNHGRNGNWV
ncbi:hypothetical protein LTS10_007484 [Elasticomyces elasticus]|nr:hypothetical protein LTS10_007484 [Elasticomyces elasticus]